MKTANYENCKRLYELTGWECDYWYDSINDKVLYWEQMEGIGDKDIPAYDLDYLVSHAPLRMGDDISTTFMLGRDSFNTGWSAVYKDIVCLAKNPADAVCELLIKVHEK